MSSKILPVPTVTQYEAPFCFFACTSMVLSHFGLSRSVSDISYEVSLDWPGDALDAVLGELVGAVKDYLGDNGLEAKYHTGGDWTDIRDHIDGGHPLIVFVKAHRDDTRINHAWVVRGYDDDTGEAIVYNNPCHDPGTQDPVAFDPDGDSVPGETMAFSYFLEEHWSGPLAMTDRAYIAVSYKGQGAGRDHVDWRGAGNRNIGRWRYHMARMTRKFYGLEVAETVMESLVAAVAFVGLLVGGVQLIGQALGAAGAAIVDRGQELWAQGGIGGRAQGGLLVGIGAAVAAIGHVVDFAAGAVGVAIDAVTSVLDTIGSVFNGSAGGSTTASLGGTDVSLGLNLKVHPWETRWGGNWEKIGGSWTVATGDVSRLDRIEVWWSVNIRGWGLEGWSLGHRTLEVAGTVAEDVLVSDGNHHKKYFADLTDAQGIRMAFGEDKCHYGRGGAMTRVQLDVEVRATLGDDQVTLKKSGAVWGFSA